MGKEIQILLNCLIAIMTASVSPYSVLVSKYPMHDLFLYAHWQIVYRDYS